MGFRSRVNSIDIEDRVSWSTAILLPCRGSLKRVRWSGRAGIANLANMLTLSRLVLVPIFLFALFSGDGHELGCPR